jgi:hypothetical protein
VGPEIRPASHTLALRGDRGREAWRSAPPPPGPAEPRRGRPGLPLVRTRGRYLRWRGRGARPAAAGNTRTTRSWPAARAADPCQRRRGVSLSSAPPPRRQGPAPAPAHVSRAVPASRLQQQQQRYWKLRLGAGRRRFPWKRAVGSPLPCRRWVGD